MVLGAFETRFSSDDRHGQSTIEMAGRASAAGACELFEHWADYRAGRIPRRLGASHGSGPPQGGAFAARGMQSGKKTCAERAGNCTNIAAAVDVLASRRGRADEQCGRAFVASCGNLAETFLWNAERRQVAVSWKRC